MSVGPTLIFMTVAPDFLVAMVTAPDRKTARRLARMALEARLVACANLVSGLESHYWWQGRLERASEVLIIFKTRRRCVAKLKDLVLAQHPYETPEFVTVPVTGGAPRYLAWWKANTAARQTPRSRAAKA